MHRGTRRPGVALLVAYATVVAVGGLPARAATTAPAAGVIVRRTANGVPHVVASTYRGLGFGLGFAYAQDNLCLLADDIVTINGERSRWFGPDGHYRSYTLTTDFNNLKSDFFFANIKAARTVERLMALRPPLGPSQEARDVAAGYAAGYNRYLAQTGVAHLPGDCRGAPWVRPITAMDIERRMYQLALFASSQYFLTQLVDAKPPAPGVVPAAPDLTRAPRGHLPNELGLGSNAIALGRDATKNHAGMLLANPHFPWQGVDRFYESHLTIPGRLDVAGVGIGGVPAVNIGHTMGLAWSHTVSIAYRFTPYELHLVPGDPTSYTYAGATEHMTTRTVTVLARTGTGPLEPRTHTFYSSRFGPMLEYPDYFLTWGNATAYALADANANNLRVLDQYLAIDRAQNLSQLQHAESYWQGIPWVNTIATDSTGHAYYADQSVVPAVPDSLVNSCVNSPVGKAIHELAGLPVLDGSRADCGWRHDRDAVVPGIFGPASLPRLTRTDYVENSNDSYWLSNPHQPLTGFPRILGAEASQRSTRTRLGLKMIEQQLASGGFTLRDLQRLVFNDRNFTGELLRDDVAALCERTPAVVLQDGSVVALSEACPVLRHWDLHGSLDSRGEALWHLFINQVLNTTEPFWLHSFDAADPINTPYGLNPANVEVMQGLGIAVRTLRQRGLPLDVPWGQVHRAVVGGIAVGGCDGGEGCFDVATAYNSSDPLAVDLGSSFVMAAEITADGPDAQAILTHSQSTNPGSPYRTDQTHMFAAKRWRTMVFTPIEVKAAGGPVTHLR
jgi:acyl-homoserine-lactone acylase